MAVTCYCCQAEYLNNVEAEAASEERNLVLVIALYSSIHLELVFGIKSRRLSDAVFNANAEWRGKKDLWLPFDVVIWDGMHSFIQHLRINTTTTPGGS